MHTPGWIVTKQKVYSLEHLAFKGNAGCRLRTVQGRKTNRASAIETEIVSAFVAYVLESAGLPADAYRTAPLHRRLPACLRALKAESLSHAWSLIRNPQLASVAVDSLMIGTTEYFRDAVIFNELRDIIAIEILMQKKPIRIWSAGCSNGAELYSMAMLLAEAGFLEGSMLVGTDCRVSAIQEAQAGLYSDMILRSLNAELRQKYLRKTGGLWRVVDPLRQRLQWHVSDLLSGCENGPWDIILWRNVAIYLKPESVQQVWAALIKEMRPGGFLIIGKADQAPVSTLLRRISRCIYQLR
jgi:chemotaxis protein methyltransferase CheR